MKLVFLTSIGILLLGVSFIQAQNIKTATPKSFTVSSMDNGYFAMVGVFEGKYSVLPDKIEIELEKGNILLRNKPNYNMRRQLIGISVGLATNTERGWNIKYKSDAFAINTIMSPESEYLLSNVKFEIPGDMTTDLSRYWLVFEISQKLLDTDPPGNRTGTSYAHSAKDIFGKNTSTGALPEDCLPYNPALLRIINEGERGWLLTDGRSRMVMVDNETDAYAVLNMARKYSQHCFIGRGNKRPNRKNYIVEYWK